ncbi:glutathione S-transferase C-terminal domain-containing protein [Streptomyces sp. CRN 30]|uniref:glutathione S-transferase C-terminal domain-containing protein n=1 Tax=Streptomyces sp. CRN 30 TaxID=3075613 RepID=UPI002A8262E1|nr:glutathione S-transferase C-terminal domain-containing protein [Streptomyces sp. CRN 30]
MYAISPTALPAVPSFRSRIGGDARSGYYAVPHRYRLYLSPSCPDCLEIAVTHGLLGLADTLPVTWLPAEPDAPDGGHLALRPLYEASWHQHTGPTVAPVLSDGWTGRIVSTHAPDILRDLARRFGGRSHDLHPYGADEEVRAVGRRCEDVLAAARQAGEPGTGPVERGAALDGLLDALGELEDRLAGREFVLGDRPTTADVRLWVTLVRLDVVHAGLLDAAAVRRVAGHPRLWAYARRLAELPAFGTHLDVDALARGYGVRYRGAGEAAGAAAGHLVDWVVYAPARTPEPVR